LEVAFLSRAAKSSGEKSIAITFSRTALVMVAQVAGSTKIALKAVVEEGEDQKAKR
jgi:hypothetical protein